MFRNITRSVDRIDPVGGSCRNVVSAGQSAAGGAACFLAGGMVRIKTDAPIVTAGCGTATVLDFVYSGGNEESRKAVIAALYMAVAMERQVRLYISDTACSPPGAPVFTGLDVLR